jgi:TonB-linked SusC/RagA family outer membrane protein
MRLSVYGMFLQVFLLNILLANDSSGQKKSQSVKEVYVNIQLEGATIAKVFRAIESQTDYNFNFDKFELNKKTKLNIRKQNVTVADVLMTVSEKAQLKFKQVNRTINVDKLKINESKSIEIVFADVDITGKVIDENGQGLPGASVVVKGTTNGATTDIEGSYKLSVPENALLTVSFVGYTTQEVSIAGRSTIDIQMIVDAEQLDEVVIIGYGTAKKSDLTGAMTSIASEDLTLGGSVLSAAQALQGRVAGVVVQSNSKEPGGSVSVRIRGSNSISSSNEPLYVIDGFPVSFQTGATLNPNDIASMQILKDASATAIYGSRGANGVILITTKRGKENETSISYSGYQGFQKINNPFEMLNGKQYMNLANDLHREFAGQENEQFAAYTQSQLQSDVNTNWIEETTRLGKIQNHFIQVNGGSKKTKVMASFGYFKQEGLLKNTDMNRFTGRINIDQEINEYIKVGGTVNGVYTDSQFKYYGGYGWTSNVLGPILNYSPVVKPINDDGSWGRPPGGKGDNPLANLIGRDNNLTDNKVNTNMFLEIKPTKNITAVVRGGFETNNHFHGRYLNSATYLGSIDNGVAHTVDGSSSNRLFNSYVTYNKEFDEKHSLSAMVGYSYEKFSAQSREMHNKGYSTDLFSFNNMDAGSTVTGIGGDKYENILISTFGRVNYSLDDKYLLTFTLRRDGSSRFGSENQWGLFPSGAFAWRLSDEAFMQSIDAISDFKFRLGYGKTGNDQIGNYASYALVSNTHYTFDGSKNVSGTNLSSSNPENKGLKWETTSQFNFGLDMGFFGGRLSVVMDTYLKKTEDLLVRVNLPRYSGFSSGQTNVGSIENKGLEIGINSKNTVGDLKWSTALTFSSNSNKVVKVSGAGDDIYFSTGLGGRVENYAVIREGESLGSLFGYTYEGVLQQGESYAPQPNSVPGDPKFKDISGPDGTPDGIINALDRDIIGSAYPDFVFGIDNRFEYKNFDLSIFFTGSVGNELLNVNRIFMERSITTDALNRWTTTNTDTDIPRNGFTDITYGSYANSHFIEDATFLRLKQFTLGYTIPKTFKVVQAIRVYFMAEDLLTFTNYTGWNPEVNTRGYSSDATLATSTGGGAQSGIGGNQQTANGGAGLDWNAYPAMRTYTFGIKVTF